MKEHDYDKLLNIKTEGGLRLVNGSVHYHPYEPTPYSALEKLFETYEIKANGQVVDFGCGKGRLNFYINHFFDAAVTGIEMNKAYFEDAIKNRKSYLQKRKNRENKIHFLELFAEEYDIDSRDNQFYFFNPFSVQVFTKVLNNILLSIEKVARDIDLVFYYPSEDYIFYLENHTAFKLIEEVRLPDLYEHNPNERFLIYRLSFEK